METLFRTPAIYFTNRQEDVMLTNFIICNKWHKSTFYCTSLIHVYIQLLTGKLCLLYLALNADVCYWHHTLLICLLIFCDDKVSYHHCILYEAVFARRSPLICMCCFMIISIPVDLRTENTTNKSSVNQDSNLDYHLFCLLLLYSSLRPTGVILTNQWIRKLALLAVKWNNFIVFFCVSFTYNVSPVF